MKKSHALGVVLSQRSLQRVKAMKPHCSKMLLNEQMQGLASFEDVPDSANRKCKIICTMGPNCWDVDMLVKLIDQGMDVCRLNFSHGDHEGDEDAQDLDDDDDEEVRALLFQLPFVFGNSSFAMDGALPSKGGELKRATNFLLVTSPSLSPALPP